MYIFYISINEKKKIIIIIIQLNSCILLFAFANFSYQNQPVTHFCGAAHSCEPLQNLSALTHFQVP